MISASVRIAHVDQLARVALLTLLAIFASTCKRAAGERPSTESPAAMKLRLPADLTLARSTTREPAPTQGIAIYVSRSKILIGEDARAVAALGDPATLATSGVDRKYKGVDPMLIMTVEEAIEAVRKEKQLGPGVPAVLVIDARTPFKVVGDLVFTVQHARFERWVFAVQRADGTLGSIVLGIVRPPSDAVPLPALGSDAAVPKSANVSLGVRLSSQGFALRSFNRETACPGAGNGLSKAGNGYDFAALTACATREKQRAPDTRDDMVTMSVSPDLDTQALISAMDALRQTPDGMALFPAVGLALVH